ncbi:MAG: FKBP-type peptidyl-prolyl cis-trans isomerase [Pseudomonadota bacterium]
MPYRAPLTLVAVILLALTTMPDRLAAQSDQKLESPESRLGYTLGIQMGEQVAQQFGPFKQEADLEAFLLGLRDALTDTDSRMSPEQISEVIKSWQAGQADRTRKRAEDATKRGDAYREANKSKPGVKVTDSGIQYKVLNSGAEGGANPTKASTVVVHYEGTLIDGTVFDSSYKRGNPATFPLNGVIPGWTEIVQLMKPGDKWQVVLPPQLAYGERGTGGAIGPNETLRFDIELIEIKK